MVTAIEREGWGSVALVVGRDRRLLNSAEEATAVDVVSVNTDAGLGLPRSC